MSQQKEDSVRFSLRSLMQMEEERIKEEEDAKVRAETEERNRIETARRREEAPRMIC
jgi:colicin import membrane protein